MRLHTFGCSITQGFALPDIVRPLTPEQEAQLGRPFHWTDVHINQPSIHAWPARLAQRLSVPVDNHARRGACFQQISRQCAAARANIRSGDVVIVMWTYISRISLQWPARTSVPFYNMVDTSLWTTIVQGVNKFFGITPGTGNTADADPDLYQYLHQLISVRIDPRSVYDQYYNNLVLLEMTAGFLRDTGARVIHLSVEPQNYLDQLDQARTELAPSLRQPYVIPGPQSWYTVPVDHHSCRVIHDPSIPPAKNDQHPSEQHHENFAELIYQRYFAEQ